jgi:hypothetical protein
VSESADLTSVRCDVCGYEYPNPAQAAAEPPGTPCPNPNCGATTGRSFYIVASDSIEIHDLVESKAKRSDEKKPYIETQEGKQRRVSEGDYVAKYRRIDRDNDRYVETVIDGATGEVIHSTDERLSEHWGHGDAKPK